MRIPPQLRQRFIKEAIKNGMRVLTYDTETSHMVVRTFYIGQKVSIHPEQLIAPSKVITIQWKWAHEKEPHYLKWKRVSKTNKNSNDFDDSVMINKFADEVLSQADLVIGQNMDRFDFITLNERAKALKLSILNQVPTIDILKLSRNSFKAASHKLNHRSKQQGLGGKRKMEDDDWVDIEERGVEPEVKMVPYGLKDATDTETLCIEDEMPYYKSLPVAVEKVIYSFLKQEEPKKKEIIKVPKIMCMFCSKKHRKATDITKGKCNTCGYKKHVRKN